MSSVNKSIIVGRLGQAPESRDVGNSNVCNFSVATSEKWKDKDGVKQEKTSWHNIKAWGKLGEICQKYLKKGDQVYIEGSIEYRENDGKYYTDIKALNMTMLGGGNGAAGSDGKKKDDKEDDDIPFNSAVS
ncbi:single-stranded DNA-binding protein [Candidatus Pacearchaeota archaeon]|nr:single-stranded DNA-binding protein [Candidatus Pacearchaeota archaeon]